MFADAPSAPAIEAEGPAAGVAPIPPHHHPPGPAAPGDPFVQILPQDAEVEPDPLQLRLNFHRQSTIRYDHAGGRVMLALVSALDVAHALASELNPTTGTLPPDTL